MPVDLKCLDCKKILTWPDIHELNVVCQCGKTYPVRLGIPDFRIANDPYCGNEKDSRIADDLANQFHQKSFLELIQYYYQMHCPELNPESVERQMHHILNHSGFSLNDLRMENSKNIEFELNLLDIGCGTGNAMIKAKLLAPEMQVTGLDIAMRWLILARKRLDEFGFADMKLVCGNAEQTPFDDGQFQWIHGGDMIEHVEGQSEVFQEAGRLLSDGGKAVFLTPNRTSLTREPHVGLYFAGWLPNKFSVIYCMIFNAPPWQGIFTHTVWGWQIILSHALRLQSGLFATVKAARVGNGKANPGHFIRTYDTCIESSWIIRNLALIFGPVLEVSLEKRLHGTGGPASPFSQTPGLDQTHRPGQ